MILKALYDYYYRGKGLARPGLEYKELAFLIVIDEQGRFLRLEDSRIDAKRSKSYLLPKAVNRTSGQAANLCWDNCSYVLNLSQATLLQEASTADPEEDQGKSGKKKKEKKNCEVFAEKIAEYCAALPQNKTLKALQLFYEQGWESILASMQADPLWEELCKNPACNLSFRLNGADTIVPEDPQIVAHYLEVLSDSQSKMPHHACLVTGEEGYIVKLTTATPIAGSQATAKLVSFKENSGYDSYGKTKAYNAPISHEAEFAYTSALKHLLGKDSRNMFRIGTKTFVFWASTDSQTGQQAEECFFSFLNLQGGESDDPDRGIAKVEKTFKSIFSGELKTADDDRFFILGLAPNAARLAVVYWREIPIREFAGNILQHFEDMDLIDTRPEKRPYKGMYSMLSAVTLEGKSSEVQPNLPDALVKSIFQHLPYPYALYSACIRRIRAEQSVTIARAAIVKACLNRQPNNHHKLIAMLDSSYKNAGYVCGRLFATLEYLQKKSSGLDSIRQRYLNAASTTPAAVFGNLMNLSVHHEEKLNEASATFFRKLKNEILDLLSSDGFPAHLDIQDQGRFFVGYHHQMAEFYRKKEVDKENME